MRKWRLWSACFLLLVSAGFAALLFFGVNRDRGRKCFDRIQVGMPYPEVEAVMEEYGFRFTEGDVEAGEATMLFEQDAEGVRIVILVPRNGLVASKWFQELGAKRNFFERLFRQLTGK